MHSLRLTAIPQRLITAIQQDIQTYYDLDQHLDDIYSVSFEHYCSEHLNFLNRHQLSVTNHTISTKDYGISLLGPGTIERLADRLNHFDLEDLAQEADKELGERFDAATLMYIVKERLIPIVNYCAIHQRGLVLYYG